MAKSSGISIYASPTRAALANSRAQQSNGQRASGGKKGGGLKFAPSARSVTQFRQRLVDQFGKALGASIYKQTDVYAATAGAGRAMVKAGTQQLAGNAAANAAISTIFKQGEQAQSAAYAYAAALQLKQQTAASDSQVAQFAADMMMARQQHEWALQEQDHQAQLAAQAAQGTGTSPMTAKAMTNEAGTVGVDIVEFMRSVQNGEVAGLDSSATPMQVVQAYQQTSVYGSDANKLALASMMVQTMWKQGGGYKMRATEAFNQSAQTVFGALPGADKWLPDAIKGAQAGMHKEFAASFIASGPEGMHWDAEKGAWVNDRGQTPDEIGATGAFEVVSRASTATYLTSTPPVYPIR